MDRASFHVVRLSVTVLLSVAVLLPVLTRAQVTAWVRESFDSGPPMYGFAYMYPESGNYRFSHLPTGGHNGGGAAHLRTFAGREQYGLGWATVPLGRTFTIGEAVYIRFRIRYDDDQFWAGEGALENKFIQMGQTGVTPNSRIIVQSHRPHDSRGCTLGWVDPGTGLTNWLPGFFGLPYSSWSASAISDLYGSLSPHVNISWDCAPPVAVTRSRWYHVQIRAKSGNTRNAEFTVWVNNNTYTSPTSRRAGFDLGVVGWSGAVVIGGYQTEAPSRDGGFRLDDFEVGPVFDGAWFPGAPANQPPSAPSNVQIR